MWWMRKQDLARSGMRLGSLTRAFLECARPGSEKAKCGDASELVPDDWAMEQLKGRRDMNLAKEK